MQEQPQVSPLRGFAARGRSGRNDTEKQSKFKSNSNSNRKSKSKSKSKGNRRFLRCVIALRANTPVGMTPKKQEQVQEQQQQQQQQQEQEQEQEQRQPQVPPLRSE
jgi:hypothetical protein